MFKKIFLSICSLFLLHFHLNAETQWSKDGLAKIKKLGASLAKKNQMECLNTGIGSPFTDSSKTAWGVSLMSRNKWTVDQARPVVVGMVQDFLDLIYTDPIFPYYVQEQHKRMPKTYIAEFSPIRIGIRIGFWDPNYDRYLSPAVAQIMVVDGKILYYQTDPKDQSLQEPPHSETFEEAFSKAGRSYKIPEKK